MKYLVMYRFARPAGGRRFSGLLCAALGTLALACPPAAAQLPDVKLPQVELPLKDGAARDLVPGDVVEQVVNEPLPEPVEQVVQDTPVAPVREEVRRLTSEAGGGTGGGGNNGGGTGSGGGSPGSTGSGSNPGTGTGTGAGAGTGTGTPSGTGGDTPTSNGTGRDRADRRARARRDGAGRGPDSAAGAREPAGAAPAGSRERSRDRSDSREAGRDSPADESAAVRTIETIAKAVPTPLWIALGVLTLLALALGGRTFVERRRAAALTRDREALRRDVALLERALLPAVPERVGGLATSVAYRPSAGPAAGGDFYDAFELPEGRAAVIVGDVSGHGPEALAGTNAIRTELHALLDHGVSPRAALAAVGRREHAQLNGRFTTVVVAVHDPEAGTLTYAAAGHPPPIVAGTGAVEPLTVGASPPIGVELRTGLRETTLPLPRGSVACFFTDGLLEAHAGNELIGRARLTEMVAELEPGDGAEALLERVVDAADEVSDDMAVCLVRPVAGAVKAAARVEVLELDPDDLGTGLVERFLEACGLSDGAVAAASDRARATVAVEGGALVEVTIPSRDGLGTDDLHVDVLAANGDAAEPIVVPQS